MNNYETMVKDLGMIWNVTITYYKKIIPWNVVRTCYKCILSIPKFLKSFIKSFVNQRQEQAQREVEQRQAEEAEATGAAR